jgi:hypothetical protein
MATVQVELERSLEADDGVVEVRRLRPHLDLPWAVLPPGPRRWAPTDLSAEVAVDGPRLDAVRMTYRTVGERSVVVAGLRPEVDVDAAAERLATPLVFAHLRRVHPEAPIATLVSVLACPPRWDRAAEDGWRAGVAGVGERPARLAHLALEDGHLLVAAHGVAEEELRTLVAGLQRVSRDDEQALEALHTRHRRALAQRWWDAPRVPWTTRD